ncbi:hypothetical protein AB0C12_21950 [Actinoplanes sp. NPDC048967]|uniref:hypothetical protein n=1 Tax=Actinoplanes sp. NPDC048967 TaxID=3155269 RepID=UPI0033D5A297
MPMTRLAALCANLDLDPRLREALDDGGLTGTQWDALVAVVRAGRPDDAVVVALLDAVEDAAGSAGLDGISTGPRGFEPLPGGTAGTRAVHGWRCPHPRPCGRGEPDRAGRAPACALTGDPLAPVRIVSE